MTETPDDLGIAVEGRQVRTWRTRSMETHMAPNASDLIGTVMPAWPMVRVPTYTAAFGYLRAQMR
jgi:hypothetical protein